ncbi:MAG: response regulator [Planctomycetes bacterium]|nr:response regulator [Planctomycetota bacterium]
MKKDVVILIAEDDIGHFLLAKRRLRNSGVSSEILHFPDGQLVIDFLNNNCIKDNDANYLLLLDIRMPKIDGIEILDYVKKHPDLKDIAVVIVTTSDNPMNVLRCRQLKCDGYIVKPLDDTFIDQIYKVMNKAFSMA